MRLSTEWHIRKTRQIQSKLSDENLDGILLLDPYNIKYATGFFYLPGERPLGLFIPAKGEPTFLVPLLEKESAETTWVERVVTYFDFPGETPVFKWMLSQINCKHLGIDHLDLRSWKEIHTYQPTIKISDLIYTMRLVKDPEEITILEKAAIYADLMVTNAREAILSGLSETSAYHLAKDQTINQMKLDLGELVITELGLINGCVLYGDHVANPHGLMTERKPKAGEVAIASFGALVATYESESEHTFILGEPDKKMLSFFNTMYGAWKAGLGAARPGVTCAEVNEAALNVVREAGYEKYLRHRMGHGKGLQEHEPPWVEAGDNTVLLPGMIISDEPGVYVPGYAGFRHSDTLLITETGCRRLTNYPRELEACILPFSE